jgi:nicotinate-nucleotide adenylyltransferase
MQELGLERVLLMPAGRPPHKTDGEDPGPEHRLRMCRLAIEEAAAGADRSGGLLGVCALEIERGGPSYTVDTLRALHAAYPDSEITFILGADVARTLPSWREPRELLALAQFAVALRPGTGPEEVRSAVASLSAAPGRQFPGQQPIGLPMGFLTMPTVDISSSLVRERVRRGLPIAELVGPAVASYIAEHDLYHASVGVAGA